MIIERLETFPVKIPVRKLDDGGIAPYCGSKDSKGTTDATSLIFKLTADDGQVGWGEMNLIHSLNITEQIVKDFLEPAFLGKDVMERNRIMESLKSLYNPDVNTMHLASGAEIALWDLAGKNLNCPVYQLLGGKVREQVPAAYAFGYMDEEETKKKVKDIRQKGYLTMKTKGGFSLEKDIRRAFIMREAAGSEMEIRVDMNQAYRPDQALRYGKAVEECRLQYVEQPMKVRMLEEYQNLRRRTATPVAINEDAYIPGGILEAWKRGAADAVVVDLESMGGIGELQKIAHFADMAGVPMAHHCAWDMGIKTAAIIHAAVSLAPFTMAMDTTYREHEADILKEPIPFSQGAFQVTGRKGLGIEVDEDVLKEYGCKDRKLRFVF